MSSPKKTIIWKDNLLEDMGIWFFLATTILFFFGFIASLKDSLFNQLVIGFFLVLSVYYLLSSLFSQRVFISNEGIFVTNISKVSLGVFKKTKKGILISWPEIKSMTFQNFLFGSSWVKYPRKVLVLKTTSQKKYLSLVNDKAGFLSHLNKIGRSNLIKDFERGDKK